MSEVNTRISSNPLDEEPMLAPIESLQLIPLHPSEVKLHDKLGELNSYTDKSLYIYDGYDLKEISLSQFILMNALRNGNQNKFYVTEKWYVDADDFEKDYAEFAGSPEVFFVKNFSNGYIRNIKSREHHADAVVNFVDYGASRFERHDHLQMIKKLDINTVFEGVKITSMDNIHMFINGCTNGELTSYLLLNVGESGTKLSEILVIERSDIIEHLLKLKGGGDIIVMAPADSIIVSEPTPFHDFFNRDYGSTGIALSYGYTVGANSINIISRGELVDTADGLKRQLTEKGDVDRIVITKALLMEGNSSTIKFSVDELNVFLDQFTNVAKQIANNI